MQPNSNQNNLLTRALILLIPTLLFGFCSRPDRLTVQDYDHIQEGFVTPADTNKHWCYYYWIGDDISKEGITMDLEAMKEFGIGAVLIGNINPEEVDGPVPLFSDEWWDAMVHVVNEGHRTGIDVGFFNCPGWSQSGGPWVTHDKAMRHLVYSEVTVSGPGERSFHIPKPAEEFQDTYVLAFRKIQAEKNRLNLSNASVTCNPGLPGTDKWLDGDKHSAALFPVENGMEYTIDIQANQSFKARSITIIPAEPVFRCDLEIQAMNNGSYESIKKMTFDRSNTHVKVGPVTHGPVAISLGEIESESYRIVCSNLQSIRKYAGFSEILISEAPVLESFIEKSLGKMHPTPLPAFDTYLWDSQEALTDDQNLVSEVIDLSERMNEEGDLTWDAPDGEWTILRMGMTPTGTKNKPAAPQGKGYEIDKASAELARFHFEHYMLEIIKRIPEENLPALKYVIADSYEMGSQNWTDGFALKFEERFGYDPVKYLPVLSGRIVGSVEESDRFLWDLRRAVADDVAYEYVGGLRKVSNEHGLKVWLENYGHWGYPGEFLMYGGQSDLVSGEFWNEGSLGDIECKSASSAAHMYGKPVTSAEAFTASRKAYTRHPALLKKRGDWSLTEGINHIVLHLYIQQPREETPGINAWFSTEFNRHNTWFEMGSAWVEYLRRCQHMLQQGTYVADMLYFIGEDAPKMTGTKDPGLPSGYSYDYINAEVILNRLSVREGKFVLPDGLSYSILVLPENANMRPAVLAKIEELVKAGGTILGDKPLKSPSLQNFPDCDREMLEIADRMWGASYAGARIEKAHGKGYLLNGMGLQEALELTGVAGDVIIDEDLPLLWTHRSLPGMEIYFITNQGDEYLNTAPTFRVSGLEPQLWDAVSGEIRKLSEFSDDGLRTSVPISLHPHGSCFIVFTSYSNEKTGDGYRENLPEPVRWKTIDSEWIVEFENNTFGPGDPVKISNLFDWSESDDSMIKYYSGTATYTTRFSMDEIPPGELILDLGEVGVMAKVSLNGQDLGVAWMAPYRINITGHLTEGDNRLEIEVVNTWRNRLVGDENLSPDERFTIVTVSDVREGEALMPSGLMGPVSLGTVQLSSYQQ